MKSNFLSSSKIYRILSFFLPVFCLAGYFFINEITPFGNNTFLIHDMNEQYVDNFSYVKSVFHGENNLIYSFSRGLGGDFPSFAAYYLMNPLNIIPILMPDQNMPVGISLEMFLLFGLCGLSCFHCLEYIKKDQSEPLLLFLSLAYSLSGWMLLNAENFQFIPGAILLPIIVECFFKMKDGGGLWPFTISMALAVILNFYIGYMIWLYIIILLLIFHPQKDVKRYLAAFMIAAVISSPVWISVLRQINTTVKSIDPNWYKPVWNFQVQELLWKFLPGSFNAVQYMDDGLPAVYCGVITLLVALCFYVNWKTSKEYVLLLIILLFSLIFRPFTMIWQGFSKPHWWPYRFSFLLIFTLILSAAQCGRRIHWIFLIFGVIELLYNMDVTLNVKLENAVTLSEYQAAVHEKQQLLDEIQQDQTGIFRIEDYSPRTDNDAMHFAYAGITDFDSLASRKVFEFLHDAGYPQERYTVRYGFGNTYFMNGLLGIRCVLNDGEIITSEIPYEIAFLTSSVMDTVKVNKNDPVTYQNEIAKALGSEKKILSLVDNYEIIYENLECNDRYCSKIDPDMSSVIVYNVNVVSNGNLYMHFEELPIVGDLYLNINGRRTLLKSSEYFIPISAVPAGEYMSFKIEVDTVLADIPTFELYYEDTTFEKQLFEKMYSGLEIEKISSSKILITLNEQIEDMSIVVTIPYDERWKAEGNGSYKLVTMPYMDVFESIQIPVGTTKVLLSYQ